MEKYGEYVCAEEGDSPLILTCPHSAEINNNTLNLLPGFIRNNINWGYPEIMKTIQGGQDIAAPAMTGFDNRDGHTRVWTTMPRAVLDVNRTPDQVDKYSVEGAGAAEHAHGLIFRSTALSGVNLKNITQKTLAQIKPILKRPYTKDEFKELLQIAYYPFFEAVREQTERVLKKYGHAIIAGLHTFLPYTAAKVEEGKHKGAYIFGKPVRKSQRSPNSGTEFFIDMTCGKMPDMIMLTNPEICSPVIPGIVREEFEKKGCTVSNGYGPFEVKPEDAESKLADMENNVHFIGLEHVGHDNLEPGRDSGSPSVNEAVAAKFRLVYQEIFRRFAALKTEDLQ